MTRIKIHSARGRCSRLVSPWLFTTLLAICPFVLPVAPAAAAIDPGVGWTYDQNLDRIDDRIAAVNAAGWNAAFVNGDPTQRMRIAAIAGAVIRYGINVRFDHPPTAADVAAIAGTGVPFAYPFRYIHYVRTEATFDQIQAIAALAGVQRVEAVNVLQASNHIGTRVVRARDSRGFTKVENYTLFPSVRQELGLDGTGIVIAILDTGVNDAVDSGNPLYLGHESLRGKFLGGGEFFYGDPLLNTPFDGSMNPQDHGAEASQYHATHVAGTAMGSGGPGGFFAGVAPAARLVDCKVLTDAGASVGGAAPAIEWCVHNRHRVWPGLSGADLVYSGVDILNLSLGGDPTDGTDADAMAINAAVDSGLIVVAATGNLAPFVAGIASPSSADKCISVGASLHNKSLVRTDDRVTSFSQFGPRADDMDADHFDEMKPAVIAPGFGIVSADGDPSSDGRQYKPLSGTSMASPHVAGCAALLLQTSPGLTQAGLRSILQNTAEHNIPMDLGSQTHDPYGLDPNYYTGCGWGLVDLYAAAKELMNSTSGVQVTQVRLLIAPAIEAGTPADSPLPMGVRVTWITQREFSPFLGFDVYRAPDVNGAPGAFVQINGARIAPSPDGDPNIQGDDNRTSYEYLDQGPLELGMTYWYRVGWTQLFGDAFALNLEPPAPIAFGQRPRVATVYYQIAHNAPNGDLTVRVGTSSGYTPNAPDYVTFGPSEAYQDSARVFAPGNPFYNLYATVEHFWSIGLDQTDGVTPYLPPTMGHPWFLNVAEGGFADQSGIVTAFSMFVNDSPGSSGGTTYVTDSPTPRPLVEMTSATFWIPEAQPTPVLIARLDAVRETGGVRILLELMRALAGATAEVYRGTSAELSQSRQLSGSLAVQGTRFTWLDETAQAGVTYHYWVRLVDGRGSIMSGPVAVTLPDEIGITFALPAAPNPSTGPMVFQYRVGHDVAPAGATQVSLALHDLQGRRVRDLKRGREGAGAYRVAWDGANDRGARVAPGVYYLRFRAGGVIQNQRIAVVR